MCSLPSGSPTRPCRLVFHPDLPLSPEPSGAELSEQHTCPENVRFYHGSYVDDYNSFLAFQRDGVLRTGPRSYYARGFASYWTTSSSFAVWWAARRQVNSDALQYASDDSPSRASLRARDNIPPDLSRCVHRVLAHFDTSLIAETTVNELTDHIHAHVTEMLLDKEAYRTLPLAITGKIALRASVVDDAHTMNSKHLSTADLNSRGYYTFKEFRNTSVHSPYSISVPMMLTITKVIANPRFLGTFTIAREIIKNQAESTLRLYANALRADFVHAVGRGLHIDISPTRDAYKLSSFHRMKIDVAWVHWYVGAAIKEHFAHTGMDIGEQRDSCGPAGGDACGNVMTGEEGVEGAAGGDEGTDGGYAASGEDSVGEAGKRGDAGGEAATDGSADRAVKEQKISIIPPSSRSREERNKKQSKPSYSPNNTLQ